MPRRNCHWSGVSSIHLPLRASMACFGTEISTQLPVSAAKIVWGSSVRAPAKARERLFNMRTSLGSDAPLVVPLLTEPSDRPVADQRFVDHKHYPESVTKNYAKPGRRRNAAGSAVKRLNGLIKYWADAAQIITGSRQDTDFGRYLLASETWHSKASIAAAVAGAVSRRKERPRRAVVQVVDPFGPETSDPLD